MKQAGPRTAEQISLMHEYCITNGDITSPLRRKNADGTSKNLYIPKSLTPVCEHPEQGWCQHRFPTEKELQEINARIGGKK